MKTLIISVLLLIASSFAQAKDLSNIDSPSYYFQNNPEAVQDFIQYINQSDLSADEKSAYKALVSPSIEAAGDDVLEMVDTETLRWFYGAESEENASLLHKAAIITKNADVQSCKQYTLCVHVSKGKQRMTAYYNGRAIKGINNVKVSTARPRKWTPVGTFTIGEIAGRWRTSNRYKGAALYYAMQINGNIFIHATSEGNYSDLGTPASAGCVRTHLSVAEPLNQYMLQVGRKNIRVVVTAN